MNKLLFIPVKEWRDKIINSIIDTINNVIDYIKQIVSDQFKAKIVDELPETGNPNILYLIKSEKEEEGNYYDEYLWIDNKWECVGSTKIEPYEGDDVTIVLDGQTFKINSDLIAKDEINLQYKNYDGNQMIKSNGTETSIYSPDGSDKMLQVRSDRLNIGWAGGAEKPVWFASIKEDTCIIKNANDIKIGSINNDNIVFYDNSGIVGLKLSDGEHKLCRNADDYVGYSEDIFRIKYNGDDVIIADENRVAIELFGDDRLEFNSDRTKLCGCDNGYLIYQRNIEDKPYGSQFKLVFEGLEILNVTNQYSFKLACNEGNIITAKDDKITYCDNDGQPFTEIQDDYIKIYQNAHLWISIDDDIYDHIFCSNSVLRWGSDGMFYLGTSDNGTLLSYQDKTLYLSSPLDDSCDIQLYKSNNQNVVNIHADRLLWNGNPIGQGGGGDGFPYYSDNSGSYTLNTKDGYTFIKSYNEEKNNKIDIFNASGQRIISIPQSDTVQYFRPGDKDNPVIKLSSSSDKSFQLFYPGTKKPSITQGEDRLYLYSLNGEHSAITISDEELRLNNPASDLTYIRIKENEIHFTIVEANIFRISQDAITLKPYWNADSNILEVSENKFILKDGSDRKLLTSNENGVYYKDHNGEDFIKLQNNACYIYNPLSGENFINLSKYHGYIYNPCNGKNFIAFESDDIYIKNGYDTTVFELYEDSLNIVNPANNNQILHVESDVFHLYSWSGSELITTDTDDWLTIYNPITHSELLSTDNHGIYLYDYNGNAAIKLLKETQDNITNNNILLYGDHIYWNDDEVIFNKTKELIDDNGNVLIKKEDNQLILSAINIDDDDFYDSSKAAILLGHYKDGAIGKDIHNYFKLLIEDGDTEGSMFKIEQHRYYGNTYKDYASFNLTINPYNQLDSNNVVISGYSKPNAYTGVKAYIEITINNTTLTLTEAKLQKLINLLND